MGGVCSLISGLNVCLSYGMNMRCLWHSQLGFVWRTPHLGSNEIWPLASQEADKPCFGLDTFFLSSFRVKTIRSPAALTWPTDKKINKCKHLPVRVGTMSIFMSGSLLRASSSQGWRRHHRHNWMSFICQERGLRRVRLWGHAHVWHGQRLHSSSRSVLYIHWLYSHR